MTVDAILACIPSYLYPLCVGATALAQHCALHSLLQIFQKCIFCYSIRLQQLPDDLLPMLFIRRNDLIYWRPGTTVLTKSLGSVQLQHFLKQ